MSSFPPSALGRSDRQLGPLLAVAFLLLLAWTYVMSTRGVEAHLPYRAGWSFSHFLTAFLMWSVMMAGMMLPSVAPWIRVLSRGAGRAAWSGFLLGYLTAWTGYSLLATLVQWGSHELVLLAGLAKIGGGAALVLAGGYQWTSWKEACLDHCRSPLDFFLTRWRSGPMPFYRMGLEHGLYCVGCCWALMLLSLVVGMMNLLWMAFVTVFIFIDHSTKIGLWFSRGLGLLLVLWGTVVLLR